MEDCVYNPPYSLPIGGYLHTFTFCSVPSHFGKENYITHEEFSKAMKEYCEGWAVAQKACEQWVQQEQVKDVL